MYCLHPSKDNPTSWRLEYKSLSVQEYFSFKKFGSESKAKKAMLIRDKELAKRKRAAELRTELDINLVFDDYGNVKGLGFVNSSKNGLFAKMQVTINGKQRSNTRTLHNRSVGEAFDELVLWRMEQLNIKPSLDIKRQLKMARKMFEIGYKRKKDAQIERHKM